MAQVLKGSPFALGISPAPADPAKCVASLDGAIGSGRRVEAGKELVVTVQLRDRFGNITQQAGVLCCLLAFIFKVVDREGCRAERGLAGKGCLVQLISVVLPSNMVHS